MKTLKKLIFVVATVFLISCNQGIKKDNTNADLISTSGNDINYQIMDQRVYPNVINN